MIPHIKSYFHALTGGLIAPVHRRDADTLRRAYRVVALHLAMLLWVPVFSVLYILLGAPQGSNVILSGGALLLASLIVLKRGRSPEFCGNLLTASAWYVYTALASITGGLFAPVMVWYATIPVLSVLLAGTRAAKFWSLFSALTVATFGIIELRGVELASELSPRALLFLQVTGMAGVLMCIYLLVNVLSNMEFGARQQLHEANCQLELQAATDGMTGIANRQRFDTIFAEEWKRHERTQMPLSVLLIDADHFKSFNDEYGHLAGDDCLRAVARAIRASIRRPTDTCARFGGEEFAVLLPNTDAAGATRVAELIRMHVRLLSVAHLRSPVCEFVTVSVGLSTTLPCGQRTSLDFLRDVDLALYQAKAEGRDRIVQFHGGYGTTVQSESVQSEAVRQFTADAI